jgi:hypothetical protein
MTIKYEQICKRAYQIWEREGKPEGKDQEHWILAEEELRAEGMKGQKGRRISSPDPAMIKASRGENL